MAAVARARAHAKARAAHCKRHKEEEETEEDGEEMDDGEKKLMAPRVHVGADGWQHRRAMSDGQQKVLAAATQEGLTLPNQNLPTPLIVRNTFIEAPVALPLSSRFSRLRQAASCPPGGQRGFANYCSMLALEKSEDEAAVVAAGAPELLPQMQPLELAALSIGSMKHDGSRRCKPCAFVHTDVGCSNGIACAFCHECSPGEKLRRRKEQKARSQARKQSILLRHQAAEGKEMTKQPQFAPGSIHPETPPPVLEYQDPVTWQAEGSCGV